MDNFFLNQHFVVLIDIFYVAISDLLFITLLTM